jgi:phage protein D
MSPTNQYQSSVFFKIDGQTPSDQMLQVVREVVVDTSMYLPDMFVIHLNDPGLSWIDSSVLAIGKSVELSIQATSETSAVTLMKGEIVAIEPELAEGIGVSISVRGYDKSHRLHRGRKSRVFQQSTDSDIVTKVAQENGLDTDIASTTAVYDHVFQDDQTDMEFIHERAHRVGYISYVENGKLYFSNTSASSASATLEWSRNLISFQARFTSAGQPAESEVRGWDIKQKQVISSAATSPTGTPTVAGVSHGGDMAKSVFSITAKEIVNNRPVGTQSEADLLAKSVLNDNCHNFFQAEGTCHGNPAVRAGKMVEVKGIGQRFSGNYLVTRAIHRYDASGYITQFEISGYRSNTLSSLLAGKDNHRPYGVVVGIVTNVKDPDDLGRVKVKFPTISEDLESTWARLATPMAGAERGIEFIPEVNDEVLVAFEYNDINRPYVLGALWNGVDKPPKPSSEVVGSSGKVDKRIIKSRSGHVITIDDTQSAEQILIVDKAGQKVLMDCSSGGEKIEITDKAGSKIVMDATAQSVSIESAKDISIKATGKIEMDGQMGVKVNTAGGDLELTSNMNTNIKGTQAKVEGTATAEFKSSGLLKIQGSIVNIN